MSAWPHSEGVAWPGRSVRARSSQLHQTKTIAARSLTRGRAPPFELDQRRRLTVGLMETSLNRDRSTRLIHLIHRPPLYRVIPRPGPRGPDRPGRARTGPDRPERARTGPDGPGQAPPTIVLSALKTDTMRIFTMEETKSNVDIFQISIFGYRHCISFWRFISPECVKKSNKHYTRNKY